MTLTIESYQKILESTNTDEQPLDLLKMKKEMEEMEKSILEL